MNHFHEMMQGYASHHTKLMTKITHLIGIPMLIVSVQVLFFMVNIPVFTYSISLAWLVFAAVNIYYFRLNARLASVTSVVLLLATLLASWIHAQGAPFTSFLVLFIVGWAIQFLGHYFEGKRPAFMENLTHSFVAPMFIVSEVVSLFNR